MKIVMRLYGLLIAQGVPVYMVNIHSPVISLFVLIIEII